jgi:excisionase family DNA binding protein
MTVKEIADYLRVHPTTVYRLAKSRQIPCFRIGIEYRFHLATIDAWTKANSIDPDALPRTSARARAGIP